MRSELTKMARDLAEIESKYLQDRDENRFVFKTTKSHVHFLERKK